MHYGSSTVPPWWARLTMVSSWRPHGATTAGSKYHSVSMAPSRCRHGGLQAPWRPHGLHGASMVGSKNHGVTKVSPWPWHDAFIVDPMNHVVYIAPSLWARPTMVFPWRRYGASIIDSKHYSGLKALWCHHVANVMTKWWARSTMASAWRPRGGLTKPWCGHGVAIVYPWRHRAASMGDPMHHCAGMEGLKHHNVPMAPPWCLRCGLKEPWFGHGVAMLPVAVAWCLHFGSDAPWFFHGATMVGPTHHGIPMPPLWCPHE